MSKWQIPASGGHMEAADGVYYQNNGFNGKLYGVDEHYFDATGYTLNYGRNLLEEDFALGRKVCVVDSTANSALFAGDYSIGKTIEILGDAFTVVGVVSQKSDTQLEINSISDYYNYADTSGGTVFVPAKTWPIIYRFDEPQNAVLRAASTDDMTKVGQKAAEILTDTLITGQGNFAYKSENLMEQAEQLQQLSNSSNRQLLWIASISLLVGGIGVMNIMLVTVTERTQEIGLKKAIGARKRRILYQFLTEAAVLTSLGGLLGIIAGVVMARLISSVMGTPTAISFPAILIAVLFSMIIGIVFGLLPAVKASNLNPIQALRRD